VSFDVGFAEAGCFSSSAVRLECWHEA
jgi:hypothetical protein